MENTKVEFPKNPEIIDDEVADMKADLEIQKYHDRVATNKLTKEEKIARDNMKKILEMPFADFMTGDFSTLQ